MRIGAINDDNPAGDLRPGSTRELLNARQMRGAAPKSCACATSRLAPTDVPDLSALPGVLERSKVAFGSRHPGNLGFDPHEPLGRGVDVS
jgi:hypothetical protein